MFVVLCLEQGNPTGYSQGIVYCFHRLLIVTNGEKQSDKSVTKYCNTVLLFVYGVRLKGHTFSIAPDTCHDLSFPLRSRLSHRARHSHRPNPLLLRLTLRLRLLNLRLRLSLRLL